MKTQKKYPHLFQIGKSNFGDEIPKKGKIVRPEHAWPIYNICHKNIHMWHACVELTFSI